MAKSSTLSIKGRLYGNKDFKDRTVNGKLLPVVLKQI